MGGKGDPLGIVQFGHTDKWYMHKLEKDMHENLWDFEIQMWMI